MDVRPEGTTPEVQPAARGSLARRYSVFTTLLLAWVSCVYFGIDLMRNEFDPSKLVFLAVVLGVVGGVVALYTHHLLAKPLHQLQRGISAVRDGRLEPVQVSRTGDEVEYLGHSLNAMIEVLKESRDQVLEYQEGLEDKIRQRTEQLEETMQKALAASRAKSEFLANISHELRTPMNGVLGMIEILLEENPAQQQREHLETAHGCANTLLSLLNDILDLSKIEAGRMLLEKIPVDARAVASDCIRSVSGQARTKGIELKLEIAPEIPARMLGDPLRLRQILYNLLSNAVKFTERGSVQLRVFLKKTSIPGQAMAVYEVSDTGMGIPANKLATIFEEFTQVDGSISRKYGGTGLGLAITHRLVDLHGGRLTVQSEVGVGSHFRVELPALECAASKPEPLPALGTDSNPNPQGALPRLRVLLAEDNLVNQKVVTAVLRKRGYIVDVATNGKEALKALGVRKYDLVLMDVQMPELDGIEAARLIRADERWKNLPIVAMTAHAMNGDRERCLNAGMNDYLSKPVSPAHLIETVETYGRQKWGAPKLAQAAKQPLSEHSDADLLAGMSILFLQLAPERMQKLHSAAIRMDVAQLRLLAQKLEVSAQRIAAFDVARCAAMAADAASSENYSVIQESLMQLDREIKDLDQRMSGTPRPALQSAG